MKDLIDLIDIYLGTKELVLFENVLDKIVNSTTQDNYLKIIKIIDESPNSSELDLSMYINKIANPDFLELERIIHKKLKIFIDIDAIYDLQMAFKKIKSDES